jgi:hypothetical protein
MKKSNRISLLVNIRSDFGKAGLLPFQESFYVQNIEKVKLVLDGER